MAQNVFSAFENFTAFSGFLIFPNLKKKKKEIETNANQDSLFMCKHEIKMRYKTLSFPRYGRTITTVVFNELK